MLELASVAATSFVAALSGALAPGPVLAVTIAGVRRRGFWYGPLVVLGHSFIELPVVVLFVLGLAAVLGNPWVLAAIGTAGSGAMAWMGIGLLREARHSLGAEGALAPRQIGGVQAGAITSLLNPCWYVWWVTMGAVLIVGAAEFGWLGVAVFFAAHLSADLAWYSLVALGVARGRRWLNGRGYRALMVVCGTLLLVMAIRFVVMAVQKGHEALTA